MLEFYQLNLAKQIDKRYATLVIVWVDGEDLLPSVAVCLV
jgi:hypothetical protein